MNAIKASLTGLILLCLIGCAATSDDPSKGGFIGGVKGVFGGKYQHRLDEKQADIDELEALNAQLQTRLQETNDEREKAQKDIRSLVLTLVDLNSSLQRSGEQLESFKVNMQIDRSILARLNSKQQELEQALYQLSEESTRLENTVADSDGKMPTEIEKRIEEINVQIKSAEIEVIEHHELVDNLFGN